METLYLEEKNTASQVKTKNFDVEFKVSTVFNTVPLNYFLLSLNSTKDSPFFKKEMIGTTISTLNSGVNTEIEKEDFMVGFYNDNYDIFSKIRIKKSFKVKAKIRSIVKLRPKAFFDFD
jgi:hypothetical protein